MRATDLLFLTTAGVLLAAGCGVLGNNDNASIAASGNSGPNSAGAFQEYTIGQLMAADAYQGLSFSPDGSKLLTSSKQTGVANAYAVPVDGGAPLPLTHSAETVDVVGYFPRDERILYLSNRGGNELDHLYVRETDGRVRDLTPGEKVKADFVAWAPDGRSFFATTNERDPRFPDLYEYRTEDYARTLLLKNDNSYRYFAVNADRRYVAAGRIVDNAHMSIYLHDRQSGRRSLLTDKTGSPFDLALAFAPDRPELFYSTDEGREFKYLVRRNVQTGERRVAVQLDGDIIAAHFSGGGRYLVVTADENARLRPHLYNAATLEPVDLGPMPDGTIESENFAVAAGKPRVAFILESGNAPGDVYVHDLDTGHSQRVLHALPADVVENDLAPGKVVRFTSYDGTQIPGVLYTPHQAVAGAKLPAMVFVHGGPGDESRIGYNPMFQYLVNHGYVIHAINNRGSSGSGKTFFHMDDHRHGDADLDDVVAAKRMLIATGYVDQERIGVMGGSYGGYMTLAALAFRPDAFAVGVDLYGVSDWQRLLKLVPPWWVDIKRYLATEMGDPETEGEYFRRISPLFHADKIAKPLLVLQGANDPRVTPVESESIVKTVRDNKVPVEYVMFPGEGHGFRKKANQIVAYEAIKNFLDQYLKGE